MMQRKESKGCPRCGGTNLIRDLEVGEEVCGECGLVVSEEIVDVGPEWRAFTSAEKENRPRAGMARSYTLYDMGLSTSFNGTRDGRGNKLDADTQSRMNKLKKYDNRTKLDDTWGRNLSIAMAELDRLSTTLHIPKNVKEHAALIYRKALKADLIRGRSIDAFVAASLYAACRFLKVPRPLKNISKASTREHSEVSRSYRLLLRELNLKMPVDDPMKFIPKIASSLHISLASDKKAIEILQEASKQRIVVGKDPRSLAASALYIACKSNGEKITQKRIANAVGVSTVSMRNRLRELEVLLK
jgi:transcription initiation factor TFIIB